MKANYHMCKLTIRYTINPRNMEMHVRARRRIAAGDEITVQYLSALEVMTSLNC